VTKVKAGAPSAQVEAETYPRDVPPERLKAGNIVICEGDEPERVNAQLPHAQASKWT
jgi:hypothetical protein